MDPIRVGVVGCGVMGPRHAQAAQACELTELVAVADLIDERAQKTAQERGISKTYREGMELCADPDVDLVVLALPAYRRTALALEAFKHGKHVLTEKPVAMNAGEVRQLIAARGDLKAACCSSRYRFMENAKVASEFIASGALGALRTVHLRCFIAAGPPPEGVRPEWRLKFELNGGGILMNWSCYDLDYLLGICGWRLKPQTCFAQYWPVPEQLSKHVPEGSTADAHYVALIRCEGGTMLQIERGEYMPAAAEDAWQVIGSKASLRLAMTVKNPKQIILDEATAMEGFRSRVLWEGDEDSGLTMSGPMQSIAGAIVNDTEPETTLENALVLQQISDAIYESARSGKLVEVG